MDEVVDEVLGRRTCSRFHPLEIPLVCCQSWEGGREREHSNIDKAIERRKRGKTD